MVLRRGLCIIPELSLIFLRLHKLAHDFVETNNFRGATETFMDSFINFYYLIYFEIRYLTAIIFDMTRITIQASNTNTNPV